MPRDVLVPSQSPRAMGATEVLLNCSSAEKDQAGNGIRVVRGEMQFFPEPPGGTLGKGGFCYAALMEGV